MLAADSLGRLLLKQGWKQGVLFTAPSAAFLYNDIADSADATSWTSVSRNTKKNEQFVLISQTCDIVASIDDEPYVEALICKVTRNRQFLAAIDRNSARYFVVDLEAGLVAQVKYRVSIRKQSLTTLSPRPWPSDEKRFERFVGWLARRKEGRQMDAEATPHDSAKGTLYSPRQVALATFIGTPIAGALLLAANYRLLGDNGARRNAVVWGSVATVLLLALAFALPAGFPSLVLPIGYTAVMGKMAERFQGKVYNSHISAGGHKQSQWRATGIGIACLIAILVILVAIVMILPENVLPQ